MQLMLLGNTFSIDVKGGSNGAIKGGRLKLANTMRLSLAARSKWLALDIVLLADPAIGLPNILASCESL